MEARQELLGFRRIFGVPNLSVLLPGGGGVAEIEVDPERAIEGPVCLAPLIVLALHRVPGVALLLKMGEHAVPAAQDVEGFDDGLAVPALIEFPRRRSL